MKAPLLALTTLILPAAACAQSPTPPQPSETPRISKVTEDCGEGCTRTVMKIRSSETDDNGHEIISENVEVIELRSGASEDMDVNIDVESLGDGDVKIRKKVKVIMAGDGEMTEEQRAKIDAMIAELDGGEMDFHSKGDGVIIMKSVESNGQAHIIVNDEDGASVSSHGNVSVDQTTDANGTKTIRVVPDDGGEATVITIRKEKSSKSDN